MLNGNLDRRELRDLWITVLIAITLALYHLSFSLATTLQNLLQHYSEIFNQAVFLWLVALLWIAYHRWREATLRQKELKNIMSSISAELIMVVSPDRTIQLCNEGALAIFGYQAEEMVGRTTDHLYSDRRKDKTRKGEIYEAVARIGCHIGMATGERKNGETFPLEIVTVLLKGKKGAVLLLRDITERVHAESELLRAKEGAEKNFTKLQETEQLRDNLIHMIVHDMRTPLQVILAYLDMLAVHSREHLTEKEQTSVDTMMVQSRVMMTMFDTVLDVSRMESDTLPLNRSQVDLHSILKEALASLGTLTERHKVELDVGESPLEVQCDADLIKRVILNLFTNALKFTPAGGKIELNVSKENGYARISLSDDGPYIPKEHQHRIFEKFARADAKEQKQLRSVGLGLTFCRMAVEAHGGEIGVESAPGKGTTFRFSLPLERRPQEEL